MPQVAVLAENVRWLHFCRHLRPGLAGLGMSLEVLTPIPSLIRRGRAEGLRMLRLRPGAFDGARAGRLHNRPQAIEVSL